MTQIKVIAFDLFGTLVDMPVRHNPYKLAIEALQMEAKEIRRKAMTQPVKFRELFKGLNGHDAKGLGRLLVEEIRSIAPFSDVEPTLKALHQAGYRLCVISNLAEPYGAAMTTLPRELFEAEILSYEAGTIKPEAAIFETAAERMGCELSEMLMVGDRVDNDVNGPLACGVAEALCIDRAGKVDAEVPTIRQLTDLVQRFVPA